jgi:hypothetical protein
LLLDSACRAQLRHCVWLVDCDYLHVLVVSLGVLPRLLSPTTDIKRCVLRPPSRPRRASASECAQHRARVAKPPFAGCTMTRIDYPIK